MDSFERFLDALQARGSNIRRMREGRALAQCPAHVDDKPSLSITKQRGKTLINCFAECSTGDVLAAVGLKLSDLFDEKRPTSSPNNARAKGTVDTVYQYVNAASEVVYEVVRFEPKDFKQRQPDGNGGWVWNLHGVDHVLYHLPEVLEAVAGGKRIFLTEGEKDADRLRSSGLVATTSPGGAGKWKSSFTETLAGADVVLIPDNDKSGRNHMLAVGHALQEADASVTVMDLSTSLEEKGDISDWLDSGNSADDIGSLPQLGLDGDADAARLVLDDLAVWFEEFMYFEDDAQRDACALWVANTYVYDHFEICPYLAIDSPEKRAGKTVLLDLISLTAHNPLAAASISTAALYRVMEERRPTLLIDEMDAMFSKRSKGNPAKEDLRGILNAGFQKGRPALRMGGPRYRDLEELDAFGPKALAGMGSLPDTIADRSIPIHLQRKPPSERRRRVRLRLIRGEGHELRARLDASLSGAGETLGQAFPDLPDELNDRAQDMWEPLFAIADFAGGDWPERARKAARNLHVGDDTGDTTGIRLLSDIRDSFTDDDRLFTATLIERLANIEESPWGDWYGKGPITARFLAERLKPFGIKSKTVRIGEQQKKGYLTADFFEVWARYLVRPASQAVPSSHPNQQLTKSPIMETSQRVPDTSQGDLGRRWDGSGTDEKPGISPINTRVGTDGTAPQRELLRDTEGRLAGSYAGDLCRCGKELRHFTREGYPYCDECGPPTARDTAPLPMERVDP